MSRKTMFIALCVTLVGLLAGLGFAASLVLRISTQTARAGRSDRHTDHWWPGAHPTSRDPWRRAGERGEYPLCRDRLTAIITIDSDSLIRLCNPAAEAMFGYTAADVVGINVTRLLPSYARDMQAAGPELSHHGRA